MIDWLYTVAVIAVAVFLIVFVYRRMKRSRS